jgi:curli production assembly/transport component CsgE
MYCFYQILNKFALQFYNTLSGLNAAMRMIFSGGFSFRSLGRHYPIWVWLALAWAGAAPAHAQRANPAKIVSPAAPAIRPQPVPKARLAPAVIVTPSKKPLPPAQLEEALRLLLRTDSVSRRRAGTEASGLVLDQALTKLGHDFYDLFYGAFEAPSGSADFTVLVGERPGRGNSSLVVLTVNDQELLEVPLPTRLDQMEELVAQTIEITQGYLAEAQNVSRQLESGRRAPLEVY